MLRRSGTWRYNDQLSDLSPRAENDALARARGYLARLSMIDTNGLSVQEKLSVELMERRIIQDEEGARFKEWEMPVNQFGGLHTSLPGMVNSIPFATVKEYDDWVTRMGKMPAQFRQVIENMMSGIDDGRVQPQFILEIVLKQVKAVADGKPEETAFAEPLKRFPASFSAADKKRTTAATLDAIQNEVQPAYARFARFLTAQAIPAGRKEPGVWAIKDGDAYLRLLREAVDDAR